MVPAQGKKGLLGVPSKCGKEKVGTMVPKVVVELLGDSHPPDKPGDSHREG